jgi:bis(5'-nucleosyl)-tetraphosphatase (symmetrical)
MSTWVVGDVHGCYRTFRSLLQKIDWDSARDELWFTGDLVNRGPRSLDVLRWALHHEKRITTVLGNHDLWFLGRAMGLAPPKKKERLDELLEAPDRDELVAFFLRQPVMHRRGNTFLVHAGLWPSWTLKQASDLAVRASLWLQGPFARRLLEACARQDDPVWAEDPEDELAALGSALMVFTGLRVVGGKNSPACASFAGPPEEAPSGSRPWYAWKRPGKTLIFGHWAALGHRLLNGAVSLDTGCVYGGQLTAYRLEDGKVIQQGHVD